MTAQDILNELRPLGRESYKSVLLNHGVKEPCFGVKIEDMKNKFVKRIKKDHKLALELYDTGNYDAMYLAGLIADDAKMTRKDLQRWVSTAQHCLVGFMVPWVATGSPVGLEMAREWIESKQEQIAVAGWGTFGSVASVKDDGELDLAEYRRLLTRVERDIHNAPNDVRHAMNSFLISVGCYVKSLTETALKIGEKLGPITVDMGNTSCQTPYAPDYIRKVQARGSIGKKRKHAKC